MGVIHDTLTPKQQKLTKISGGSGWSDHPENGTKISGKIILKVTCSEIYMEVIYDTPTPKQQKLSNTSLV